MSDIIVSKTPLQVFSKSLVALKYVQFIQKDLEQVETNKLGFKIYYLNQSYIFHLVALWEVFIEQELIFGYDKMMLLGCKSLKNPKTKSYVKKLIEELHTPSKAKIDFLFSKLLGIETISKAWHWEKMENYDACQLLKRILTIRHEIAHQSSSNSQLSFDTNFLYMKHLFNLATVTEYEVNRHVASVSGTEFNVSLDISYPEVVGNIFA